jgi:hypothetical protein
MFDTKNLPPMPLSHKALITVLPTSNLGSGTDSKLRKAVLFMAKKLNKSRCKGVYDRVGMNYCWSFLTFLLGLCSSMSMGYERLTGFWTEWDEVDLALSFLSADARMGVLLKMKLSWWEASTILSLKLVNFFLLCFLSFWDIVVDDILLL